MTSVEAFAPAKINLTLHVTGQRSDGYHLLDSLVVFASVGDRLKMCPGTDVTLTISGPEVQHLTSDDDNLVLRAARLFRCDQGAEIELIKTLPVASGIGGGSADAAATLKALARLWDRPLPAMDAILGLGADVPVCVMSESARMRGIGDDVMPVPPLPGDLGLVLVNPRVEVSTQAIFNRLDNKNNGPMETTIPAFADAQALGSWLKDQRNDLQIPAIAQAPVIGDVLEVLSAEKPLLARMSGSGATCFGLYPSEPEAKAAAIAISARHPEWWVECGHIAPQTVFS